MAFDGIVTANLTAELKRNLLGGRVSKIAQPEPDEILLTIKNFGKETFRLRLCVNASLPLVYLTSDNPLSPITAPNFCMLLRKHIGNARITDVSQPGLERVIRMDFEHLDEMGDLKNKSLMIELMGKYSNLIFCDENGIVIDSIKRVSASISSVREVLPGREYFIPNTQNKEDPLQLSKNRLLSLLNSPKDLTGCLTSALTGISRVTTEELAARTGSDPSCPASSFSDGQKEKIADVFLSMMDDVKNARFSPCIAYQNEEPLEFSSLLLTGYSECEVRTFDSVSEVLETFFEAKNRITRMRQKSAQLRKLVSNAIERASKKYDLQLHQLNDTDKREKYRVYGEMLNTYGYSCPEGARSFDVVNYYTGEPLTIPLDPTLTAAENAVRFFEKYGKLKRTYEALNDLILETREELDHLESVSASIDMAVSDADLNEIRSELVSCGYMKPSAQNKGRKDIRQKSHPFHYRSSDGFDIYVGKNNLQNDWLTFHFAQGGDIWMHAKKAHGSHVIIRTDGKPVPDRTYEEAGALAAYYSQAKNASKTEVDYIEKKAVKKPPKAKPGFVIYNTNYSLMATPSLDGVTLIES